MSEKDKPSDAGEKQQRKYEAPKLIEYGRLRRLTTGGSGNANEGEMGNAMPRP